MPPRIPIVFKVLFISLIPCAAALVALGLLTYRSARTTLEHEMDRRLSGIAAAIASELSAEELGLLEPGDEETRTARNLKRRLTLLKGATGVARIFVFDERNTSYADTAAKAIGDIYHGLMSDKAELKRVFGGTATASVLFRDQEQHWYKNGYAPVTGIDGQTIRFVVAVTASADFFYELDAFGTKMLVSALVCLALVTLLALFLSRQLTRPIDALDDAARTIGAGNFAQPILVSTSDEIGQVAATMDKMRRQLADRDERMRLMIAGVAHEVRNPLAGMKLSAELLREEVSPELQPKATRVAREIVQLEHTLEEFLGYARRQTPVRRNTALEPLIHDLVETMQPLFSSQHVDVAIALQPAYAIVDAGQIRRAIANVLQNALDATHDQAKGRIEIELTTVENRVQVRVHDSGPGIDPNILPKLGAPFVTTKPTGSGLGLALVRDILADHGGTLEIANHANHGAVVTLRLLASDKEDNGHHSDC